MVNTCRPAFSSFSFTSGRRGFTAMPWSVTTTSTTSPGVTTVLTRLTMVGMRPRVRGATTTERLAPSAVSGWPPMAPRMTPSEPVRTLTLKSVSISRAERITKSSWSTAAATVWLA